MTDVVVDLCAGPGGWEEAARLLELDVPIIGIEWEIDACKTARAAGHHRICADIATYPVEVLGTILGLIASTPCTAFSNAGKGEGRAHADALIDAVHRRDWTFRPCDDPTVWLVLEIGRWVEACKPRWIVCENVPSVLPLFHAYEQWLRGLGYSTWSGVVNAADYGVPQTRERAFLEASLDRTVGPPPPTHARRPEPSLFGQLLPWVSMATALGWGMNARPSTTVMGAGIGAHPLDGGSGSRAAIAKEQDEGRWQYGFPRKDDTGTSEDGYRERDWRSIDEPAFAVTEKARSFVVRANADELVVNTGRDWKEGGTRDDAQKVPLTEPAPTFDTKSRWRVEHRRGGDRIHEGRDPELEPAECVTSRVDRWQVVDGYRITEADAAVLQSFRPDYPWKGNRTSRFKQIGNAVPPVLAAHVMAAATGRDPASVLALAGG